MNNAFENYLRGPQVSMLSQPIMDNRPREKTWSEKNSDLSFTDRARRRVYEYVKSRLEKTDTHVTFNEEDVYVVMSSYILSHWKVLVSTTLPDGMYYEVTHNSHKKETYIDAYKKFDNVCLMD